MTGTDRIIGKDHKYRNTAVLIPVVQIDGELQLLFEKRSSNIPQANEICFPGGRVDKADVSAQQTVIRETGEELGISRDLMSLPEYLGTLVAPLGITVDAFIGFLKINDLNKIKPNISEVESVFCVPIAWFKSHEPKTYYVRLEIHPYDSDDKGNVEYLLPVQELGLPSLYEKPWDGRKFPVYVYKNNNGIIWGITAELIIDFINHFNESRFQMS